MYVIIMEIYMFKVHVHCIFLPFFIMACTLYTSQYCEIQTLPSYTRKKHD